ncbi:hypothetical protein D3C77_648900 [compost metagenome]
MTIYMVALEPILFPGMTAMILITSLQGQLDHQEFMIRSLGHLELTPSVSQMLPFRIYACGIPVAIPMEHL